MRQIAGHISRERLRTSLSSSTEGVITSDQSRTHPVKQFTTRDIKNGDNKNKHGKVNIVRRVSSLREATKWPLASAMR